MNFTCIGLPSKVQQKLDDVVGLDNLADQGPQQGHVQALVHQDEYGGEEECDQVY